MTSSFVNGLLILLLSASCALSQFTGYNISVASSVIAGSSTTITWNFSTNLTLALLLKQGVPFSTTQVVSVIAQSGISNTGSYTWNIDRATPPGTNYYLRLQTGSANDWSGGMSATGPPTPDGVFSLSGLFAINSTTGSTSSLNPASSVISSSPTAMTQPVTTDSTPVPSTVPPAPSSSSNKSSQTGARVISGSVVVLGSLAACAILLFF